MNIGIFDKRKMLRNALRLAFKSEQGIHVVCETGTANKTLGLIKKKPPDTVIIDPALYGNKLYHFIHVITSVNPKTRFVLLQPSDDKPYDPPGANESNVIVLNATAGLNRLVRAVNGN